MKGQSARVFGTVLARQGFTANGVLQELNPGPDNVQQAGLHITMALNCSYVGRIDVRCQPLLCHLD